MNILTIDIGGTTTKRAIINDQGELLKKYPPINTIKGHSLKWLFDKLHDVDLKYDCISVDVPGFYNKQENILTLAGNLEYRNFDIVGEIKKYTDVQSFVINDANAAALGEFWKLNGGAYKNALFYVLGTGIGGGIIINGELYEGSQGYAGEFGHGNMFGDTKCNCGLHGCIEPFSSAKGITNKVNEYAQDPKNTKLHAFYQKKLKTVDHRIHLNEINNLVNEGDQPTLTAIKEALQPLIRHMSLMTYALNPEIIIVGGGPTNYGEPFRKIISELYINSVADWLVPTVELVLARQLNDAALYGCAYYAIKNYKH